VTAHGWVGVMRGWRVSAGFVWISLLGMSAVPWPSVWELRMVDGLTGWVIGVVAEVFWWFGTPVEVLGDRLVLHGVVVEVTDGCSGVRSFQSFLMATWFFAEFQRLRAVRVGVLLAGACGAAFLVNVARTYWLAVIRFRHGEEAFERAHDWLGLLAFVVSGCFFYWVSGCLSEEGRRVRLVRRAGKGRVGP